MDTKRLHQFRTLVQTGHLRKAAELLHITHAGLSKSIRALEEELGIELTSKDGRNLRITQEGLGLMDKINHCLKAEEELLSFVRGNGIVPLIRIGTFEVFSTYFAPLLVSTVEEHAPVQLFEMMPNEMEQAVIDQKIDYGITYLPIPKPNLDHFQVGTIQMGVFGTSKWLKSSTDFKELSFVIPVSEIEGTPTKVKGLDGWPDGKVYRKVQYTVSLMETALSLVRQGLAVAYLPKFIVNLHNAFVRKEFCLHDIAIPKGINTKQPVYAIKHKDREEDRSFKLLCKSLRQLR